MKRDKELIKHLLFYAEEWPGPGAPAMTVEVLSKHSNCVFDISTMDFLRHGELLFDKGLAKGRCVDNGSIAIYSITWDGYEFIDNARNSKVWAAATKAAGDLSWDVFISVLTATATNYAKSSIGLS